MGVANSYTMEASFAGSTMGSRIDTHFTAQDFEAMGRSFCETLLDFCDEDPDKVSWSNQTIEVKNINQKEVQLFFNGRTARKNEVSQVCFF